MAHVLDIECYLHPHASLLIDTLINLATKLVAQFQAFQYYVRNQ